MKINVLIIFALALSFSNSVIYGEDCNAYLVETQVRDYPFMNKIADYVLNTDISVTTPKGILFTQDTIFSISVYKPDGIRSNKLLINGSYIIRISSTMIYSGVYYCFSVKSLRLLSDDNLAYYFTSCENTRQIVPREKILLYTDDYDKYWIFEIKNGNIDNAFFICEDWNMQETDLSVYDLKRKQLMTKKQYKDRFCD